MNWRLLAEAVVVVVTMTSKFLVSGKSRNSRRWGFYVDVLVTVLWAAMFIYAELYLMAVQCIVRGGFSIRGVINNRSKENAAQKISMDLGPDALYKVSRHFPLCL